MDYCKYVDPFYGNFEPDLPEPNETASKWFFLKAQTGNTTPAAVRPFGMVSACAYTGGYPTGYGAYLPNSYARPQSFLDINNITALGFSHFHQSGTGYIGVFYNFSVITPVSGTVHNRFDRYPLTEEFASPGYYSCKLGETKCNVSVSETGAVYEFEFETDGENSVVFDPVLNGIFSDEKTPSSNFGKIIDLKFQGNIVLSTVEFENNITLYTALTVENFYESKITEDSRVVFKIKGKKTVVKAGFSFKNQEKSKENLLFLSGKTLNDVKKECENKWNSVLSKINIQGNDTKKTKFYSNLHRCFIKPVKVTDNNHFGIDGECYCDFATLWDVSKTHLPLLFTLFGEKSTEIVNSFISIFKRYGLLPNSFLLSGLDKNSDMQARALMVNSIYDAFLRGIDGVSWNDALSCMVGDIERYVNNAFFHLKPVSEYPSHTIDLAIASYSIYCLATELGEKDIANKYESLSKNWALVYDKNTGEITENGKFYEGCNLNYSYRLLPYMEERIKLSGGKKSFEKALDEFFGFDKEPATQCHDYRDLNHMKLGEQRRGFEGFNNETDMESPYCYAYIGKHIKTCEIVRSADKYLYGEEGKGALCGNEDSGALSSLYIVNALGLFPVFGQDKVILGSPSVEKAEIKLSNGNVLNVVCQNFNEDVFDVKEIYFNNKRLHTPFITVKEMMAGGEVRFVF